jgi:hypothetical protein
MAPDVAPTPCDQATWQRSHSDPPLTVVRGVLEQYTSGTNVSVLQFPDLDHPLQLLSDKVLPPRRPTPNEIVDTVKQLVTEGRNRKALARLYDAIDGWLGEDRLEPCDELLSDLDMDASNSTILVGALTITLHVRDRLAGRAAFFERVREHLQRTMPDRVEEVLRGLE